MGYSKISSNNTVLAPEVLCFFCNNGKIKKLNFSVVKQTFAFDGPIKGMYATKKIISDQGGFDAAWNIMMDIFVREVLGLNEVNLELQGFLEKAEIYYKYQYQGIDVSQSCDLDHIGTLSYMGSEINIDSVENNIVPNLKHRKSRNRFQLEWTIDDNHIFKSFSYGKNRNMEDALELAIVKWGEAQIEKKGIFEMSEIFRSSLLGDRGILGLRYKDDNNEKSLLLDRFDGDGELHEKYPLDEDNLQRSMQARVGQAIADLKKYYGNVGNGFENIIESGNVYRDIFRAKDLDEVVDSVRSKAEGLHDLKLGLQAELAEWQKNR